MIFNLSKGCRCCIGAGLYPTCAWGAIILVWKSRNPVSSHRHYTWHSVCQRSRETRWCCPLGLFTSAHIYCCSSDSPTSVVLIYSPVGLFTSARIYCRSSDSPTSVVLIYSQGWMSWYLLCSSWWWKWIYGWGPYSSTVPLRKTRLPPSTIAAWPLLNLK